MTKTVDPEARFLDLVVVPLVRDSMLWPILVVFVLHLVAGLSYALAFSLRERRPAALLALGLAIFLTFNGVRTELRVRGRPEALSWILAATWLLSIAAALVGHHAGVFSRGNM
jgi:CDP-diglyceride synthetase